MLKSSIGRLRLIGLLEGTSFLALLLIAMPLKYAMGMPKAVSMTGMGHGLLFVLYFVLVLNTAGDREWSFKRMLHAMVMAVVPFGPFIFDKSLKEEEARWQEAEPQAEPLAS